MAFQGHPEPLKRVESLPRMLLSSGPLSLGVAMSRDSLEESLFGITLFHNPDLRLPPPEAESSGM